MIKNIHKSKSDIKEIIEEKGKRETAKMERFISVISVVAVISPLLGLLGTVSGMIVVFRQFVYSQQDPTFMSDGISKALITTATGLIVAIPSLLATKYLYSKIDNLILDLEDKLFNLIELKDEFKEKR
jgi:biopolymer transport protein ExbB